MCNTAPSANSLHCPDLLYTPQGSGGLLGCSLTLPCCLLLYLWLPLSFCFGRVYFCLSASLHLFSLLLPLCVIYLPLSNLFLALLGWTSWEINWLDEQINRKKVKKWNSTCWSLNLVFRVTTSPRLEDPTTHLLQLLKSMTEILLIHLENVPSNLIRL